MRIIRICDNCETVVSDDIPDLSSACKEMMRLAREECHKMPNNPSVEICGRSRLGVYIGQYKMVEFYLDPEPTSQRCTQC